ncbi:MAG TPA: extracellular solute-binding protein [Candidatus Ruania gallistercoris]|uniref:Extracellular solute-binding protein n=1 Tax=Candidatus Ruania gallistercoris TaxID=2838746 RepID=A0A9D2EFG1_9MICO|nr:extracellular solute-binding protein [Candidatus Ruania gallistercoris]
MSTSASRHRRLTRRTFLGGTAAAATLTTTACISGADDTDTGGGGGDLGEEFAGTVEWWTINLQANYADYIQTLIDSYTSEHPDVTINWVDVPGQDINTKLLAALASGEVPDAVNYTSDTVGRFASAMSDLNEVFSEEDLATYQTSLVQPLTTPDGKLAGIPWYNGGAELGLYRKSALEVVGFDPENPPSTWDEALELAEQYRDETGEYGGNLMAYSDTIQSEGIALLTEDRTAAAFNTPECVEILEKFKVSFDSGAIAPGVLGKDPRNYEQSLDNEQIAFNPSRVSSQLLNVENNAPDVYEDLAVAPAVTGPPGIQYLQSQQIFGIPQDSDNKAAAAAWLKFVTSAENLLEFCKLVPIFPSTPASLEDAYFTDIDTSTPSGQGRKILVDTFPELEDGGLQSHNDVVLREIFDEEVRAFMSGNKSAEDALAAAEEQWNTELSENQQ